MNNTTNRVFSDAQQAQHREAHLRMEAMERRLLLARLGNVATDGAHEADATNAQLWSAVALKHGIKVAQACTTKARRAAFH